MREREGENEAGERESKAASDGGIGSGRLTRCFFSKLSLTQSVKRHVNCC